MLGHWGKVPHPCNLDPWLATWEQPRLPGTGAFAELDRQKIECESMGFESIERVNNFKVKKYNEHTVTD